ncbi:hypothetical protein ACTFIU_002374 [Dictyostelium citrinum]
MGSSSSKNHHHRHHCHDDKNTEEKKETNNNDDNNNNKNQFYVKVPELTEKSKLLNEEHIRWISRYLPDDSYRDTWKLLFSSSRDGHSFNRFQHHSTEKGSIIVIIKEEGEEGHIFGGFCDENLKIKYPKFYGDKNNFVFTLKPEIEIFRSTGLDQCFQYFNADSKTLFNGFAMGGELLYAFSIDHLMENGESKGSDEILSNGDGKPRASTYGNTMLSSQPEYRIEYVEVYGCKDLELTEEQILNIQYQNRNKKGINGAGQKSVLRDEDNADKVIKGMMGDHEFTNYHEDLNEANKDKKITTPLHK